MEDYNHNGRIDSEDELLLKEMVKDRVDESIEKHSFSDGLKGFGLVIIGLLILAGLIIVIFNVRCWIWISHRSGWIKLRFSKGITDW